MDAIVMDIKGIKCDNETCDYEDMSVEFDPDFFLEKPCPKCGESLFTQADYNTLKLMMGAMKSVNTAVDNMGLGEEAFAKEPVVKVAVEMDGTGLPGFKLSKP